MIDASQAREWIWDAVNGDARAVALLFSLRHDQLLAAGFLAGELTLTRNAVLRALHDYANGRVGAAELNRWAWFVRRGYIPGTVEGTVTPLHIDYEGGFEEPIAVAVGRFAELGDLIDGSIGAEEVAELEHLLLHS